MPFGNSGFPVFDAKMKTPQYLTASPMPFGNSGFPVVDQDPHAWLPDTLVTNAFRQFGFPRLSVSEYVHGSKAESPMPFGNSGFPVTVLALKFYLILQSHQCLSAIRVSPSWSCQI